MEKTNRTLYITKKEYEALNYLAENYVNFNPTMYLRFLIAHKAMVQNENQEMQMIYNMTHAACDNKKDDMIPVRISLPIELTSVFDKTLKRVKAPKRYQLHAVIKEDLNDIVSFYERIKEVEGNG